jgi:hypothetical protein
MCMASEEEESRRRKHAPLLHAQELNHAEMEHVNGQVSKNTTLSTD